MKKKDEIKTDFTQREHPGSRLYNLSCLADFRVAFLSIAAAAKKGENSENFILQCHLRPALKQSFK